MAEFIKASLNPAEVVSLDINEEEKTVLCIAENIVAFFQYDGAESGMRGMSGDLYYNANDEALYLKTLLPQLCDFLYAVADGRI